MISLSVRVIAIGFILFVSTRALAYAELNVFYTTEATTTGSSSSANRMFIEGSVGFSVDKNSRYLVGWNYGMYNTTDTTTTSTTYASTQMGPRFVWFMTKAKTWSLGFAYNLVTNATYSAAGGTSEKWKGTAIKVDAGYNFTLSEEFLLGLRLNYSSATYTEKLVGSTDYTVVSYTSALTYPSFYLVWLF